MFNILLILTKVGRKAAFNLRILPPIAPLFASLMGPLRVPEMPACEGKGKGESAHWGISLEGLKGWELPGGVKEGSQQTIHQLARCVLSGSGLQLFLGTRAGG